MTNNWLSEFKDFMFNGNVKEARKLTLQHLPKKLYKYRQINDYTVNNLNESSIWLSSPANMNDPYESSVYVDFEKVCNYEVTQDRFWDGLKANTDSELFSEDEKMEIRNHLNPYEHYWNCFRKKFIGKSDLELKIKISDTALRENLHFHSEEYIRHLKNMVRFCSFSENNDSLLMWSHYSEQHKGICIEYDFTNTNSAKYIIPVIYTNKVFNCTEYLLDKSKAGWLSLLSSLQKTEDWAYEKEWRLIYPYNHVTIDSNMHVSQPSAIYIGSRVDNLGVVGKEKLNQIIGIAKNKNIPVFQMSLNRDTFKMGITSEINLNPKEMPKLPFFE